MSHPLTPEQAAEALGIPEEDVETFVQFVGALRAPQVREDTAARRREYLMRAYMNGEIEQDAFQRLHDQLAAPGADDGPGEYRMSTRPQPNEPADDGEFLDDFTAGRTD